MKFVQSVVLFAAIATLCSEAATSQVRSDEQDSAQQTYTFTTIDVPGAHDSIVQGINSLGDMAGYYDDQQGGTYQAFLLQNGSFTYFDYEGRPTVARGINDAGLIVGYADDFNALGFIFDGTTFTPIKDHNKSATYAMGINIAGMVVGGSGTPFVTKGFESAGGRFKGIAPPGEYAYVYATGVNKFNQVVGWTDYDGFLYKNGAYKTISYPGSTQTEAWGINDPGQVVGWYTLGGNQFYGFISANGRYQTIQYPGALATLPLGINNAGQVVGEYTFDYQSYHGFLATPTP